MTSLFRERHCFDCGSPWTPGALLCSSCRGAQSVQGATHPTRSVGLESLPLPWPWDGLTAFPAGSVIALTGGPGSGKSTICAELRPSTWVTTEQTPEQVGRFFRRFAPRLEVPHVWPAKTAGQVRTALQDTDEGLFVLDSLTQISGWAEQAVVLRHVTEWAQARIGRWAVVVLQINGRGEAAGLMELPHMVDAQLAVTVDDAGGLRSLSASKNRHGPLFSRLFGVDAGGVCPLTTLAAEASYSVEGSPGAYRLHPWPLPGAKWAGLLDLRKPDVGYASSAIAAPSYRRGVLEPADVAMRRAYAEAHGLRWLVPEEAPSTPTTSPTKARKPRKKA